MKINIEFTDIDPTHPYRKIVGYSCDEKQTLQSLITHIKGHHDFFIKALSGKKADDLSFYTDDGTKLDQTSFAEMLESGRDTTLHARLRRHMHFTAGVRGIKAHCVTSLYGGSESTTGRNIADLHKSTSKPRLFRRGRKAAETTAGSPPPHEYRSSPLSR